MNFISAPILPNRNTQSEVSGWRQVVGAITGTGEINTSLVVQIMNFAQHLLALALVTVAVIRQSISGFGAGLAGASSSSEHPVPLWLMLLAAAGLILFQLLSIPLGRRFPPDSFAPARWLVIYTGLWLLVLWISPEFIWFAFLLWLLAGHLLPFKWGVSLSALILLATILAPILHHGDVSIAMIAGPTLGGVFTYTISRAYLQMLQYAAQREALIVQLTHAQQELNVLQDDLAFAQRQAGAVEERLRISRDLHDTVAQNLSSLKLLSRAEAQAARAQVNPQVSQRFAQFEQLAAEGLTDLRKIIEQLAPQQLENSALPTALASMLERLEQDAGLKTRLDFDASLPKPSQELELALLRSAQSALANVRLHAKASRVVVSVIDSGDSVRMDIIDDGIGFDPSTLATATDLLTASPSAGTTSSSTSFGLRFIRSRMQELGGGLEVESSPGNGTALSIFAPFSSADSNLVKE